MTNDGNDVSTNFDEVSRAHLIKGSDEAPRRSRLSLPSWKSQGVIDDGDDVSTNFDEVSRAHLIKGSDEAPRRSRLSLPSWKSQGVIDDGNDVSTIYEMGSNNLEVLRWLYDLFEKRIDNFYFVMRLLILYGQRANPLVHTVGYQSKYD